MHMVRNSLDHGVEAPDVRVARGKAPQGRLALSAVHHGGSIVITVQDDGAGLDPVRIAARAVARGLLAPDATPSVAELQQLIFQPGFSTADTVTDISGRGVGMDVVRRGIDALRGRVDVQSTPGEGTAFVITVPLTLASLDGLVLGVGGERFVIPTFAVRESLRPRPDQVHTVHGEPRLVALRGHLLPLLRLADLFGLEAATRDVSESVVFVLEDGGQAVALVVDEVFGAQDVVIKTLGDFIGPTDGVAGGAILGDGRVGLILDGPALVRRANRDTGRAA
jgi:two-component system chemotaxis sensor kinase CheA